MKKLPLLISILFILGFKSDTSQVPSGGCFINGTSDVNGYTKFSNNIFLDQSMSQEYAFLVAKFGVSPNMWYYVDGDQPNAYATSHITNPMHPDGSVFIGFSLIFKECSQSPSSTCSALPIIMAHEFAHIVDFKFGTGLTGQHKELFADYLAGCYMYYRSIQFKLTFVPEVAYSFFKMGNYDFNHPDFHGTPEQRRDCLIAGYNLAYQNGPYLSLAGAIEAAKAYVKQF